MVGEKCVIVLGHALLCVYPREYMMLCLKPERSQKFLHHYFMNFKMAGFDSVIIHVLKSSALSLKKKTC